MSAIDLMCPVDGPYVDVDGCEQGCPACGQQWAEARVDRQVAVVALPVRVLMPAPASSDPGPIEPSPHSAVVA